jgi:hypothetical protein
MLTRREVLCLGAALALPSGCSVATLPNLREVDLDALTDDRALLLGRIRLSVLTLDRTASTFARTTAGPEEVLLPPDGRVAWAVPRPRGSDVRLHGISLSEGGAMFGRLGPVLALEAPRTAIYYFGTIELSFGHRMDENRSSNRLGKLDMAVKDDRARDMPAFVADNPRLAGRQYCHVLRKAMLQAPLARR